MDNAFLSVGEIENIYNSDANNKKKIRKDNVRSAISRKNIEKYSKEKVTGQFVVRNGVGQIFVKNTSLNEIFGQLDQITTGNNSGTKAEQKAIIALLEGGTSPNDGKYHYVPETNLSVTKVLIEDGSRVNYPEIKLGTTSRDEAVKILGISGQGSRSKIDYWYGNTKASAKCVYELPSFVSPSGNNSINLSFKVSRDVFEELMPTFEGYNLEDGTSQAKHNVYEKAFQRLVKESSYEASFAVPRLEEHYKLHGVLDSLIAQIVTKLTHGGKVKLANPMLWVSLLSSTMTSFTPGYEISPENQANAIICLDREGNELDNFPTEPIEFSKKIAEYVIFDTPSMSVRGGRFKYDDKTGICTLVIPFSLRLGKLPANF